MERQRVFFYSKEAKYFPFELEPRYHFWKINLPFNNSLPCLLNSDPTIKMKIFHWIPRFQTELNTEHFILLPVFARKFYFTTNAVVWTRTSFFLLRMKFSRLFIQNGQYFVYFQFWKKQETEHGYYNLHKVKQGRKWRVIGRPKSVML